MAVRAIASGLCPNRPSVNARLNESARRALFFGTARPKMSYFPCRRPMKTVSIITLGCAKNTNDTENLAGLLKKKGYAVELDAAKADAIVVHTCSFIEAAKKESIQTILDAARLRRGFG